MGLTPEQEKFLDKNWKKIKEGKKLREKQEPENFLSVKLDDSEAYNALKEQTDELKERLGKANQIILQEKAEKALKQAEELGIKTLTSIENPEQLEYVNQQIKQETLNTGNRDIPLNAHQNGFRPSNSRKQTGSVIDREYTNYAEMIEDLDQEAKLGNPEAKDTLKKLAQKSVKDLQSGSVFEFKGKLIPEKEWKDKFSYVEKDPNNKNRWEKV